MKYFDTNAWVLSRPKDAALYFDKAHIMTDLLLDGQDEVSAFIDECKISPDPLVTVAAPNLFLLGSAATSVQRAGVESLLKSRGKGMPDLFIDESDPHYSLYSGIATLALAINTGISGPGTLILPSFVTKDDVRADPSLSLTNLKLVDTAKLSWEQILEIRKDEDSARKLRDLRLFMVKEYSGKESDPEFIKADLVRRIEGYEATAKALGTSCKEGCLEMLFDKNSAIPVGTAAILAALQGTTDAALLAALPLTFTIGACIIKVRNKRRELKSTLDQNPVTFICEIKREIDHIAR